MERKERHQKRVTETAFAARCGGRDSKNKGKSQQLSDLRGDRIFIKAVFNHVEGDPRSRKKVIRGSKVKKTRPKTEGKG